MKLSKEEDVLLKLAVGMKVPHVWKTVEDYSLFNNLMKDEKNPSKKKPTKKKKKASTDLICPNCDEYLGKASEGNKKQYCGNCGTTFSNPEGN